MKVKNLLNGLVLLGWLFGNLMIFSSILYISYNVANKGEVIDNVCVAIVMILWVFGQLRIKFTKEVADLK